MMGSMRSVVTYRITLRGGIPMLSTPYLLLLTADGIRSGQAQWTAKRPVRTAKIRAERHRRLRSHGRHMRPAR